MKATKKGKEKESMSGETVRRLQWHSANHALSGDLEAACQHALLKTKTLSVIPKVTTEYRKGHFKNEPIKEGTLYIPYSKTQVALDSLIMHQGTLFLFQFTTGHSHLVRPGLLSFLEEGLGFPELEKVRLIVFIIPGDVALKTPMAESSELAKVQFCSAVFEVHE
jgi:hypothetical protein